MREELGLGSMYPSDEATREMRVLMDETGFTARLAAMGASPGAGVAPGPVTPSGPAVSHGPAIPSKPAR
jgi:hypothetical protein